MAADRTLEATIEENERFGNREARLVRVGWVVLTVILLAGLVGTSDGGTVQVEHLRITHQNAQDSLAIQLTGDAVRDGQVSLTLAGEWVSGVDIQDISPEPSSQLVRPGGVVLQFDTAGLDDPELAAGRPGALRITVAFRPDQVGPLGVDLSAGEDAVRVTMFVLP